MRVTLFVGVGVLLFMAYLRESWTLPVNSDGAGNALEAWDMLNGNLLLHGWILTDVSFYTTELPQYAVVEWAHGLGTDVIHLAAAMTYTLVLLLATLLAKGRATGREAAARMLLAGGIMLTPTLGIDAHTLLLSPDHTGTMVPLLVMWLILDRAGRRWYVPFLVGLILTLVMTADMVALLEGAIPVIVVSLMRLVRDRRNGWLQWFEIALAGSAAVSVGAAWLAVRLIRSNGGFILQPVPTALVPFGALEQHAVNAGKGLLVLFGGGFFADRSRPNASFFGAQQEPSVPVSAVHMVGLVLAAWALCLALRRCHQEKEFVVPGLAVAVVVVILAYLFTQRSSSFVGLREMAGVLPMTAVLAGRLLPARVAAVRKTGRTGARRFVAAGLLVVILPVGAFYVAELAWNATRPSVPAQYQSVETWLAAHHLSYGLGGYWQASSIALESAGRIRVRAVHLQGGRASAGQWGTQESWYEPRLHNANFAVMSPGEDTLRLAALTEAFGPPAHSYRVYGSIVLTWHKNLLIEVAGPGRSGLPPGRRPP